MGKEESNLYVQRRQKKTIPLHLSAISFTISSPTVPMKLTSWNLDLQMMPKNPNFYNILHLEMGVYG